MLQTVPTNQPGIRQSSCAECLGLLNGTRPSADPHEYLVLTGRSEAIAKISSYKCLLCGRKLVRHLSEDEPRWA